MYRIFVDDILYCDSRIEELALISPVVNLEENKAGSFTFKTTPLHPYYDLIKIRKSIVQVFQGDEEEPIFSGMCVEITNDFYNQKSIYCEGELSFFNDSVQRQKEYKEISVRELLEAYISNHNELVEETKHFEVGTVTVPDPDWLINCYSNYESTMQCLNENLLDKLGGFFRIRHEKGVRYIDYIAESMNENFQEIALGDNLLDFTSNINSLEIATAIIPLGAKQGEETESSTEENEKRLTIESMNFGKDYIYDQDAVEKYGWIFAVVIWDDITKADQLWIKAKFYLSELQFENMVIEAKAIDLHLTDAEIEKFKILDEIKVVSKPHGLDKFFRLTKLTINLNNPENNTITLGKEVEETMTDTAYNFNSGIKKTINSVSASIDSINASVAHKKVNLLASSSSSSESIITLNRNLTEFKELMLVSENISDGTVENTITIPVTFFNNTNGWVNNGSASMKHCTDSVNQVYLKISNTSYIARIYGVI